MNLQFKHGHEHNNYSQVMTYNEPNSVDRIDELEQGAAMVCVRIYEIANILTSTGQTEDLPPRTKEYPAISKIIRYK